MSEYYTVYDTATGEIRWNGQGPTGASGVQALPEGSAALEMPYEAWISLPDLARVKAMAQQQVDISAGVFRMNFITSVPGQAETYMYKANEARAWSADNDAPTPMMTPEAEARGMTVAALAAEVLANEAAWLHLGGRIEGARVAAKAAIGAADNIAAIVSAMAIDWPALLPVIDGKE